MNEQKVKDLVCKLKTYINLLESELACSSPTNYTYNSSLHDEIKLLEEWNTEEDDCLCLGKKTIRRVQSVLKDDSKRKLYSEEELLYMERQLVLLKELRKARVQERKERKGFGSEGTESNG